MLLRLRALREKLRRDFGIQLRLPRACDVRSTIWRVIRRRITLTHPARKLHFCGVDVQYGERNEPSPLVDELDAAPVCECRNSELGGIFERLIVIERARELDSCFREKR